jgi:hypothetical protein
LPEWTTYVDKVLALTSNVRLARYKRSSLSRPTVSDEKKSFFGLSPQMTVSVTAERNKRIKVFLAKEKQTKKKKKTERLNSGKIFLLFLT